MKHIPLAIAIICALGYVSWRLIKARNQPHRSSKFEITDLAGLVKSGKIPAEDARTWRLLAVYASKINEWKALEVILDRVGSVLEDQATVATLHLECLRSRPDLLIRLQMDDDTACYALIYAYQSHCFDAIQDILSSFAISVPVRLRAGQLLQDAVVNLNRPGIEALNASCFYFDREAAIQLAVNSDDLDLALTLDLVHLERPWRYRLGLAGVFAAYDDRNERLCRHIFQHFDLSAELYDDVQFSNAIYRKWFFTSRTMGQDWYDKMFEQTTPDSASSSEDGKVCPPTQLAFMDAVVQGSLSSIDVVLADLQQNPRVYAHALIAGCVVASRQQQDDVLDKLLQLADDETRSGIIIVAGHINDLHLLTRVVELPRLERFIFVPSEIGRLMEHAVLNENKQMFSVLLQFKHRDVFSTFGMIRASIYAAHHGHRYWTDAIFGELSVLELRQSNRLLVHTIGAALETERYQLAFDYWRCRVESNEHVMEVRQNTHRMRQYADDTDREGFPASEQYLSLGFALMLAGVPADESLPQFLLKIVTYGYDIDVQRCEAELMRLKDASGEFWRRPERDQVPSSRYLTDYCKQQRPDLFPEFAGTDPLPMPNGWQELGKAVLTDLRHWQNHLPRMQITTEGIPDHLRPVNT